MLTLAKLREANLARCARWHPGGIADWSLSDWVCALGGEVGEALDLVKKLNRVRDNIVGNSKTPAELQEALAEELADAMIYLDLTAARVGIHLTEEIEAIDSGFDEALRAFLDAHLESHSTSVSYGKLSSWATTMFGSAGLIACAVADLNADGHSADSGPDVDAQVRRDLALHITMTAINIFAVAEHVGIDLEDAVRRKFNVVSERNGFPERL